VVVVSDSSPLILYSRIHRLDLLQAVFRDVLVPPAVDAEVVASGTNRAGAAEVQAAAWIQLRSLANPRSVSALLSRLDDGEAEAIILAIELGGGVPLLLDDLAGRRLARDRGLRVLGSPGMLVEAKTAGVILQVRPVLDELRTAGLWLGDTAYRELLALARE
jgi:predicted nucleic acid-binding protein